MAAAEPETPVPRCLMCTHRLRTPESIARGVGPVCLTRLPGADLLSWHHRPPRLGHLPHGDEPCEGQAVLFPVQPMRPGDVEERR